MEGFQKEKTLKQEPMARRPLPHQLEFIINSQVCTFMYPFIHSCMQASMLTYASMDASWFACLVLRKKLM